MEITPQLADTINNPPSFEDDIFKHEQAIKDHADDIVELERLILDVTRPRIKELMTHFIAKMKSDKKEMELILETKYPKRLDPNSKEVQASQPQNPADAALEAIAKQKFEGITKYGWD